MRTWEQAEQVDEARELFREQMGQVLSVCWSVIIEVWGFSLVIEVFDGAIWG